MCLDISLNLHPKSTICYKHRQDRFAQPLDSS